MKKQKAMMRNLVFHQNKTCKRVMMLLKALMTRKVIVFRNYLYQLVQTIFFKDHLLVFLKIFKFLVKEIILTLEVSSNDLHCSLRTELERNRICFEKAASSLSLKMLMIRNKIDWLQKGALKSSRFNLEVLKDLM
jgi:hypothetical protein